MTGRQPFLYPTTEELPVIGEQPVFGSWHILR